MSKSKKVRANIILAEQHQKTEGIKEQYLNQQMFWTSLDKEQIRTITTELLELATALFS